MSRIPNEQLHPNDKFVNRNRVGRIFVFLLFFSITTLICVGGSWRVLSDWFGTYGGYVGFFIGAAVTVTVFSRLFDRFFVQVDLVSAFVTTDLLYTLLRRKNREMPTPEEFETETGKEKARDRKAFPTYGPGLHLSYPWEDRDKENNFSLKEVSADIHLPVLVKDGLLELKGSYRLRPDLRNLIPFLSGVASIAGEVQDLIIAFAVAELSSKTVDEAIDSLEKLNDTLNERFGLKTEGQNGKNPDDKVSNFERRFGVYVGDVTIAEILPSKDLQKTRGALNEARVIAEGTAILLGFEDAQEMRRARADGKISDEQISRGRDRFLSVSGNLEGMTITRWEADVNITGLDPEAVRELSRAAGPIARAAQPRQKGKK